MAWRSPLRPGSAPIVEDDASDENLIARFRQSGDSSAFGQLVARHRAQVFRIALSVMGPGYAGEAEEIAQEVFLRVHASLRNFRGNAKFGSWLYRIAFNQALNVKARTRYKTPHVPYETLAERPASEGDPAQSVLAEGRNQAISAAIGGLPEVYQSAVRLHYWLGHTTAEIATLLGVPGKLGQVVFATRANRLAHKSGRKRVLQ